METKRKLVGAKTLAIFIRFFMTFKLTIINYKRGIKNFSIGEGRTKRLSRKNKYKITQEEDGGRIDSLIVLDFPAEKES